jgi:hypothetical protein
MGGGIVGSGRSGPCYPGGIALSGKPGEDPMSEASQEVTLQELEEFLEADRVEMRANPQFKERLREKLWEIVRQRRRLWRGDRS